MMTSLPSFVHLQRVTALHLVVRHLQFLSAAQRVATIVRWPLNRWMPPVTLNVPLPRRKMLIWGRRTSCRGERYRDTPGLPSLSGELSSSVGTGSVVVVVGQLSWSTTSSSHGFGGWVVVV